MTSMIRKTLGSAAVTMLLGSAAFAADLAPPIIEAPMPMPTPVVENSGSWYIRGDVGYSFTQMGDIDYVVGPGPGAGGNAMGLLRGNLSDNFMLGGGVGYDTGHYLRVDLTGDYLFRTNFNGSTTGTCTSAGPGGGPITCTTTDTASMTALSLLANAYVDIGNWGGLRPYIGAGIGGTHVTWTQLSNVFNENVTNPDELHAGHADWRFTYALMAGASYDVTDCLALDAGYRYRKVSGGKMFGIGNGAGSITGPGYDRGFDIHDVRLGARYKFGGSSCGGGVVEHYQPEPYEPVYK